MIVTTRTVGNCVVLDCSGNMTVGPGAIAVRNAVREALKNKPKKMVLNLEKVDYTDSAGIGELVNSLTHVQGQGGKLVLLNLAKRTEALLVITKLITLFEIAHEEKSALADGQ